MSLALLFLSLYSFSNIFDKANHLFLWLLAVNPILYLAGDFFIAEKCFVCSYYYQRFSALNYLLSPNTSKLMDSSWLFNSFRF